MKTKALNSRAVSTVTVPVQVTVQLISAIVFAYVKSRFLHDNSVEKGGVEKCTVKDRFYCFL